MTMQREIRPCEVVRHAGVTPRQVFGDLDGCTRWGPLVRVVQTLPLRVRDLEPVVFLERPKAIS